MKRQAFQRGEIRDENDNIISEGAYGKKTAFANKTNDGILDYIVNNFQALFDMISGAYVYVDTLPSSGDSDKLYVVNSTGKTYRWDGKQFVFVSEPVDGLSAYEIAKQNGFEGTEQEWIKSIVSDTIESAETDASGNLIFTMKSGGKIKTTLDGKINKSGDTMTGALNLANHTWNLAGDDAYFGDANKSGCLCVKGANNDTGITLINRNDTTDADCAIIRYAGKNIVVNKSIDGNITGTAETAKKLHTYYDRPASANKQFGDGNIYYYLATTSMTEGKPPKDSHIIHLAWDNQSGWDSQIAISHDNHAYWRYQNGGKWGNWRTFLDSDNFNTYAPKLDGTGATGNWNINAKTATAANSLNNAITHQIYNSNDNGGRPKLLLLYDVTTWYDKNSDAKQMAGFNGIVSIIRPNGFGSEKIILLTAFVNYTNYGIYSRNLYTSSNILVPCIVQRASDKKYFLALKCNFSSYTCDFIGRWTGGNPLFTEILYASGEGLPAGYTIVYDGNTNYPFSATNATNDSNGNAINTTYLKKADFIQQVHPVNSVIMLANGTDPNKIYSNTSWVKINTDTLGSISVNYWQRTT